jgi:hypothetical protein
MKHGRDASPSDLFAGGGPGLGDKNWHTEQFDIDVPVDETIYGYLKVPYSGFIKRVEMTRAVAGDTGAKLDARVILNGTTIQAADMTIANADAVTVAPVAVLDTDHARYDATEAAIAVQSGDLIQVEVKDVETAADSGKGLTVLLTILR